MRRFWMLAVLLVGIGAAGLMTASSAQAHGCGYGGGFGYYPSYGGGYYSTHRVGYAPSPYRVGYRHVSPGGYYGHPYHRSHRGPHRGGVSISIGF